MCFPKIPHGFLVKKSTRSSCPKLALLGSNRQAGKYVSGLACGPRIAFQHRINCCLTNKVAVESLHTFIRLRAANVNRLFKGSGSGASSSFNGDARGSTYILRALVKVPKWRVSAGSLQVSVWGTILEAQAGLYYSGLDCRPRCSSQQMQNGQVIKTTSVDAT